MTPAAWTALALWAIVAILAVIAVFIVRLLLRFERTAVHIDFSLSQMDSLLPALVQQSQKTMESVQGAVGQATSLMQKIEQPLARISEIQHSSKSFLSPQFIGLLLGLLKAFGTFRAMLGRRK